jgi:hypothetical protein
MWNQNQPSNFDHEGPRKSITIEALNTKIRQKLKVDFPTNAKS